MASLYTQPARGIRKSSNLIVVAANATAEVLYQVTTAGQVRRTVILRKIMAYNDVGAITLMIGTGLPAAWVQQYPTFRLVNNMDNEWTEDEIPEIEIDADLTLQTDLLGVIVRVEVEEISHSGQ